jgi:SAM-dependent methyltransferase
MDGYSSATYGDRIAPVYDDLYGRDAAFEAMIEFLTQLSAGGRVLELGIGTGRIALPLAARGVAVSGIDASPAMVDRLRAKPGAAGIDVTIGDFADVNVNGEFALAFAATNTFFALLSQEAQLRCLHNVAARLVPGGRFVVEAFTPDISRLEGPQSVSVGEVGIGSVTLLVSKHDAADQRVDSARVVIGEDGIRVYPVALRYAWPAELDAMAMVAGLALEHRWGDWDRSPFSSWSPKHVSIYRKTESDKRESDKTDSDKADSDGRRR